MSGDDEAEPQPELFADALVEPDYQELDLDDVLRALGEGERSPPFGLKWLTFTNGPLLAVGSWCIAAGILLLGFWPRDPYFPPAPTPPGAPAQTSECGIVTTDGTAAEHSQCIIPFVHNGVSYNACTTEKMAGMAGPWCYTSQNVSAQQLVRCGSWCEDNGHAPDSCGCGVCGSHGECGTSSCPSVLAPGTSMVANGRELWACPTSAATHDSSRPLFGQCVDTCVKQPMRRKLFTELESPEAVCMDGTSSGYYYADATTQPQVYVLYLQGGEGWCYDEYSCASRCGNRTPNGTCSSRFAGSDNWPEWRYLDGLMSSDASVSPLAGAHKAFLAYCTADAHVGNVTASLNGVSWHFRGQAVVEAAIASLVRERGLGSKPGHMLFFAGGSAGGMGAMLHIDHIPSLLDRLGARGVEVLGFSDSAYLIDDECGLDSRGMLHGEPVSSPGSIVWPDGCRMKVETRTGPAADPAGAAGHFPGFAGVVQGLMQLANIEGLLSKDCLAHYRRRGVGSYGGADERWKCGFPQYHMPYVRARYLMVSSEADAYQLTSNLGHQPSTDRELAYAQRFATRSYDNARGLLRAHNRSGVNQPSAQQATTMVFMQNCLSHAMSLDNDGFSNSNISSWSMADAVAAFVGVKAAVWPRNRELPQRGLFDDPSAEFASGPGC